MIDFFVHIFIVYQFFNSTENFAKTDPNVD